MPTVPGTGAAIRRTTSKVRDWLDRRLNTDAQNIAQLFRTSRDTLVQRIKMIYTDYLGQEPSYLKARTTGAGAALETAIDTEVNALVNSIGHRSVEALTRMQHEGHALHLIPTFDVRELPERSRYVFNELTTSVVGGGTYFDRLEHMSEQMKDGLTSDVRQSLLNGETFEEARNRVMTRFGIDRLPAPQGPAFGATMRYKNEARRQWNLLMQDIGDEAGGFAVWWATLDEDTTLGCLENHGYLVEEELDGEMPPRHINCRCEVAIMPAGVDLSEFRMEAEDLMDDAPEDAEESWKWRPGGVRMNLREVGWTDAARASALASRLAHMTSQSKGVPRKDMPQFSGTPTPGSPSDALPKNAAGRVDVSENFVEHLKAQGVSVTEKVVDPAELRATQDTLHAKDVGQMADHLEKGGVIAPDRGPIMISKDNYVLDGHHRWAAHVVAGTPQMPVRQIDLSMNELLDRARAYSKAQGIKVKESWREAEWEEEKHLRGEHGRFAPVGSAPGKLPEWQTPSAKDFIAARDRSEFKGFLSHVDPGDLSEHTLLMNREGTVGVAISKDGDIQNVFNNGGPKGAGSLAVQAAIEHGGRVLDCYDGKLPEIYGKLGFRETGRMAFNPAFANPDWDFDKHDSPDVVFMSYRGTNAEPPKVSDKYYPGEQWDAAKADSRRAAYRGRGSRVSGRGRESSRMGARTPRPNSGSSPSVRRPVTIRSFTSGKREADVGQGVVVRQLVPLEVRSLWGEMTKVTFPKAGQRDTYAVALVGSRDSAEQSALGLNLDALDWKVDQSFQDAVVAALADTGFDDPYLVMCIVPWRPEGVFGSPDPIQVETVVRLKTGRVLYAKQEFDTIEYSRAGIVCPAEGGKIWAVRPKDKNVWILPGGHIDFGEKPSAAAVREMYEETGVKIVLQDYLGEIHTPTTTTFVYLGGAVDVDEKAELDPTEIQDAEPKWVDDLYISDRIFIKKNLHRVLDLKEARRASGGLAYVHRINVPEIHRVLQEAIAIGTYGFEEEKHPRDERGRFAPKGTFAPPAGPREPAAPSSERASVTLVKEPREAPASAYQWLHDLHDDPRYVDAKEKLAAAVPTSERYGAIRDEQGDLIGVNDEERTARHEAIINEYYEKAQQFRVPPGTPPTLSYIIGNPGSGKTSFVNMYNLDRTSLVIDNDEIKGKLPEYKNQEVHAGSVQEESAYIERRIVERLNDGNYNLTLNGVGKSTGKVMDTVRTYTKNGYNADMYYMHLPEEKAGQRVWKRYTDALDRGEPARFVDPIYAIKEVDMKPEVTYDRLKDSKLLRSWKAYSSDVPRGQAAKLIEEGRRQ